jgi:SAM-dependent methyltransferase
MRMELEEYARIAAVEDDHWWYRNTHRLIADLLAPWLSTEQMILDAGCGPGGNGAWLREHGTVIGVDVASEALRLLRERWPDTEPVQASVDALPFATSSFDVAVGITVMYSVPDDARAVRELARVLRPGGVVLLFEPAFGTLRRAHDATVHSLRRYRRAELAGLAEQAGLRVRRATYAYSFLFPPAAVLGLVDRLRPHPPAGKPSDVEKRTLDRVFAPLARVERRVLQSSDIPFGSSAIVVATSD